MNRRRLEVAVLAAVAAASIVAFATTGAQPALAQSGPGDDGRGSIAITAIDTADHPTVAVDFSAPPAFGDVDPTNVTVTENGASVPFGIERTAARNLQVVLAIDTSGSMTGAPIDQAKLAASSFVDRLPPGTEIALVAFGDTAQVLETFRADPAVIRNAIADIAVDPAAETAIYDAVLVAVRQFAPNHDGPRAVVIVTDGGDTASEASLGTAQAAVEAADIPVVALSLVTSESDPDALATLTGGGSGIVVEATDPGALTAVADDAAATVSTQYRLVYESSAEGPATLRIRIGSGRRSALGVAAIDLPVPTTIAPAATPTPALPDTVPTPKPAPAVILDVPDRSWLLPAGIAAVGVAMMICFGFLLWPNRRRGRSLLKDIGPISTRAVRDSGNALTSTSRALVARAEKLLTKRDRARQLSSRLERAGIRMRPAEAVVLTGSAAIVAAMMGLMLSGIAVAVILAALVPLLAWSVLTSIGARRAERFADQLPATLQMMAGALKAGFSLSQVVDLVGREAAAPTSEEFSRLAVEENLGRDISESFRDMAERMQSKDFGWVAEAVDINRSVGGDLAGVLDKVAETIRTRQRIAREIHSLTAEGRLSAVILISVPFIIAIGQYLTNRDLSKELTQTGQGRALIGLGLVMITVGALWMKRIARLKF